MTHRLPRSLCVGTGKGGCCKTTVTATLAILAAEAGYRVIAVDLDPQGHLARALGIDDHDHGQSLRNAAITESGTPTLHRARRGLDVHLVAAGAYTDHLVRAVASDPTRNPSHELARLVHQAIAPLIDDDTIVLMDTPPAAGAILTDAALLACEHLLIPTRDDALSIDGVGKLIERILEVSPEDQELIKIVGVLLVAIDTTATTLNEAAKADISSKLSGAAPILGSIIRHARKASSDSLQLGVTAVEYARLAQDPEAQWIEFTDPETDEPRRVRLTYASNASTLASDYFRLAKEIELIQ